MILSKKPIYSFEELMGDMVSIEDAAVLSNFSEDPESIIMSLVLRNIKSIFPFASSFGKIGVISIGRSIVKKDYYDGVRPKNRNPDIIIISEDRKKILSIEVKRSKNKCSDFLTLLKAALKQSVETEAILRAYGYDGMVYNRSFVINVQNMMCATTSDQKVIHRFQLKDVGLNNFILNQNYEVESEKELT